MADISQVKLPDGTTYNLKDSYVRTNYRALNNNDFDTINVTELNAGDVVVTGVGRFTNGLYGNLTGNADTATKATQDESGNNIKANYAASFSISDHTITLKNKNGVSLGTVTVPDNNDNTWRKVQVNGTDILGTATNTNPLNLKAGTNVSLSNSSGTVTIASTDTNTTYSLSASGESVVLSGSDNSSKSVSLSTLINGLSEGSSPATSGDYIIAQYAGGGTTTSTYHRRKLSNVFKAMSSNDITTALGYTPPHEPVKDIPNTPTAIASFSDGSNLPMPKLEVGIEPVQDLHGYDAPWVGGAGKNKFDSDTVLSAFTKNNNKYVGTPTYVAGQYVISGGFKTNTRYTLSYKAYNNTSTPSNFRFIFSYTDETEEIIGGFVDTTTEKVIVGTSAENKTISKITRNYGYGVELTLYDIQLEEGSIATSFAPYSNECPISGWTDCNVVRCGENLFDKATITENKIINSTTGEEIAFYGRFSSDYIKVNPSTDYYASNVIRAAQWYCVFYYDKNKNYLSCGELPSTGDTASGVVTTPSGCNYVRLVGVTTYKDDVSFVVGNQAPSSYSAYNGHTYTIDLDGTRYGGKLDVVSGVLTVDRASIKLNDLIWTKQNTTNNNWRFKSSQSIQNIKIPTSAAYKIDNLCSVYRNVNANETWTADDTGIAVNADASLLICDLNQVDVTALNTVLANQTYCYELATPLTIQLSPTQVNSLLGVNNIFANCGKITEGKYVVQDYSDITSKISEFAQLANTASKLGSSNVGSATQPIYLSAGTATACTYTLGKSVPSDAVFTDTKYTAGDNMTLSSTTFYATKRWNAVTQGQKWSRIILVANTVNVEGNSGLLHVACTRGNTVCNSTFLINTSHASYGQITELGANNYSKFKVRLVVNSNGDYYVEIYDTASSIASGTTQTWHCSFLSFQPATITAYTTFTDGTTIPSGYTAKGEMETVVGDSALAIRNITRSGITFTATRQNGTTFTFTQQDNDHYAWSDITSKPTTISGYGITDAKIASGVITLGSNTITPLTAASTLDATKLSGTIPSGCYSDTKNTAGSTDTSSKIYLIGATSQAANPQTYSQDTAYVGTDGCLYSGGTKVLTAHQDISGKVNKSGDTMTGCLSITSANSSWAEGIRINRGNGGYCSFVMGGTANSTSGTGDNVWWLGCNPSSYSHKWFVAHNGSTQTGTYFYVDSASQQSPHFRVGGDLAVGSKTTMSKTCTLRYNDSTLSLDFIFTT